MTARRKRNVRRMAELSALRQQKQARRTPTGQMKATVLEGERSGKLVVKADKISKKFGDKIIVDDFFNTDEARQSYRFGLGQMAQGKQLF